MAEMVTVKIYGQEYNISGDKSKEEIEKIAKFVDDKMHLIGKVAGDSAQGSIAILSCINIADEYFDILTQLENLRTTKLQMENDSKYYLKMWEDSKKNFMKYKENISAVQDEKKESDSKIRELEAKCSEFESSFFDLQMENIQLKSELEKLKNNG